MMIETALMNILTNDATVAGLVGARVRPFTDANVAALPCLTYWRTNSQRPMSNDGQTGQAIGTFQLDAWAADAATCWQVLDAARLVLSGLRGFYFNVTIDSIRWEDESDQVNTPVLPGRQKATQRRTATIVVSYAESTATNPVGSAFDSAFG